MQEQDVATPSVLAEILVSRVPSEAIAVRVDTPEAEAEIAPTMETHVHTHKHRHTHKAPVTSGVTKMTEVIDVVGGGGGMGAGLAGGLGGGVLGGVLGGLLLNRGVLGNGISDSAGVVTPALLAASLAQVTESAQNTTVLQTLGDIKASVPLAEGQVQLALAGAQSDIIAQVNMGTMTTVAGQAGINKNISDAIASSLASQSAIKETVAAYGVANLTATKDAQFANQVAVNNSTKEILAALNAQNTDNLQRMLTVAESRALEDRLFSRSRETEINVTQTVNQNQAQLQAQQQQQQQLLVLGNICNLLSGLQNAVATNSNLIVGNTGVVGTGPQTANPVNVRT